MLPDQPTVKSVLTLMEFMETLAGDEAAADDAGDDGDGGWSNSGGNSKTNSIEDPVVSVAFFPS